MPKIMILTVRTETRTGSQETRISLPRVDALLDQPRYSLPQDTTADSAAKPKPPPPKPER